MSTSFIYSISGILIGLTFLPLFAFTFSHGKTRVARFFAYHLLCVGVWGVYAFLIGINSDPQMVYYLWNLAYSFVLFIPVFLLHAILVMICAPAKKFPYVSGEIFLNKYADQDSTKKNFRGKRNQSPIILILVYTQAIFFAIKTVCGVTFSRIRLMFHSIYYNQGELLYLISFLMWLGVAAFAHILLMAYYHKSYPEKRKSLFLLMVAIPLGFGGGMMNFLPGLGINAYPVGNFLIPIYSIIVMYAILQYQFLDINYILRKGLIYLILILLISIMYFLMLLICLAFFGQTMNAPSLIAGVLAALMMGFIFAPLRLKIEDMVEVTFFKKSRQAMLKKNELLQQKVIHTERFKMLSDQAKGFVYEIRNPLTTIRALTLLIPKKLDDAAFIQKTAADINRQTEKINTLLDELLKFANPLSAKFEPTHIHSVIKEVLHILHHECLNQDIKVIQEFEAPEDLILNIDATQLRQAIYHLLTNAIQAMPNGGTLKIITDIKEFSDIIEKNFDPYLESFFEIVISDTGAGITKEQLPFLFDPFFNPSEKHIGLGLTITHKIIQDHHGNILVKSEPGHGTTFTIELPIMKKIQRGL